MSDQVDVESRLRELGIELPEPPAPVGAYVAVRRSGRLLFVSGQFPLADGVLYFDEDGALQEQKAEIVVVACNGIGTPRLLLNSKSDRFPDGLANSSGLGGKNLMFHPFATVTGVFDEAVLEIAAASQRLLQAMAPTCQLA